MVLFCNFLTTLLPFKRFGVLVITIFNMLAGDIFHFLVGVGGGSALATPATPHALAHTNEGARARTHA